MSTCSVFLEISKTERIRSLARFRRKVVLTLALGLALCVAPVASRCAASTLADDEPDTSDTPEAVLQRVGLSEEELTAMLVGKSGDDDEKTTNLALSETDLGLNGHHFLLAVIDRHDMGSEAGNLVLGVVDLKIRRPIFQTSTLLREEWIEDGPQPFQLFPGDYRLAFSVRYETNMCCHNSETRETWYRPILDVNGQVSISQIWSGRVEVGRGDLTAVPSYTCGEMSRVRDSSYVFRSRTRFEGSASQGTSSDPLETEVLAPSTDLGFERPGCWADDRSGAIETGTVERWAWDPSSASLKLIDSHSAILLRRRVGGFPFDLPSGRKTWTRTASSCRPADLPQAPASGKKTHQMKFVRRETDPPRANPVLCPNRALVLGVGFLGGLSIDICPVGRADRLVTQRLPFSIETAIESLGWSADGKEAFFVLRTDKFRALYSIEANGGQDYFEGFLPLEERWPNGFVLARIADKTK